MPAEPVAPLYRKPVFAAALVAAVFVSLNLIFW